MITYLIEVSICWLLFYSIYLLLLRKETFFNINRWYLLSTLVLGLLIPLFTVEFASFFYEEPTNSVVYLAEGFSELEYVIEASVEEAKGIDYSWLTLITSFYIIGVIAAFIRFLYGFRQIYSLYQAGTVVKKGNYKLVLTQTPHLPFSFFNYLFWNESVTLEDKDSGKIITHELAHINQWHSLDVLFLEFLGIALWFSPPIYWYKKSLRTVHEYLADAYVLRDTKKKQYGQLLIRQVQSGMQVALANNFIHSQLKQRINMMTRNKSRRKALTRYLPALPLLLLMVLVFSNKNVQQNFNETTVKASLALENIMDREFNPIIVKQKLVTAYNLNETVNFIGIRPSNEEVTKMEDSGRIKNLHKKSKELIGKYPKNEVAIKALMKEVALENGYAVRFNGENIIYQSTNKEQQTAEAENFKLLVVNGVVVGPTNSIIASSEVQKLEELDPELAMERFGAENGKNGALLITSEEWTVLESKDGETILVRKDAADLYDDGNHVVKMADVTEQNIGLLTDTPPLFPGGEKAMVQFIYTNIRYPIEARSKGITGVVAAQFEVEADGSVSNLKIKNDLGGGLNDEVLRVLRLMKTIPRKWTPATKDGVPVKATYKLPFVYQLEGKKEDGTTFKKDALGVKKGMHVTIVGYYNSTKNKELKKAEPVYKVVDEMPRFPGCEDKAGTKEAINTCAQEEMLQFIYSNIKYPAAARKAEIEGTVVARFVVDKKGQINKIEIVRSIGGDTDAEVLSTIEKMPTWIPGKKDGKVVSVVYNLPVKFRMEKDEKPIQSQNTKIPTETANGELIYKVVEQMPLFPGCEGTEEYSETMRNCANQKMLEFVYANVKYPAEARKKGTEGTVVIRFLVEKDGTISGAEILRNVGGGTGEEALRVVNLMAEQKIKWVPGLQDGKRVNVNFNLPVKFKLEKQTNHQSGEMVGDFKDKVILKDGEIYTGNDKGINKNELAEMHIIRKEDVIADKKTTTGEAIYRVAQNMPRFPGCEGEEGDNATLKNCADMKMLGFIFEHVKYPEIARKKGIEGVAVVRFLVEKDGTISDAELLRNPGGGTGEEALRVVNLMVEQNIKWTPGLQDGKPVNVNFVLPIKFKLAEDDKVAIKEGAEAEKATEKPKDLLKWGSPTENVTLNLSGNSLILNAFPNPAREQLTVTLEGKAKNIVLTVFDATGKEYFRKQIQAFDGQSYETIDLTNAPKGTLIVNVRHKGKDYQKKVIVQ